MIDAAPFRGYKELKLIILASIRKGEWPPDCRVPSENELVATYGVSKTTADRALRELAKEGELVRVPSIGSFVAGAKNFPESLETRDIALDIRLRGKTHLSKIVTLCEKPAPFEIGDELGLSIGTIVFHSVILRSHDTVPVQLEDRFVLRSAAPGFLTQDFRGRTPEDYLRQKVAELKTFHSLQAVMPKRWERDILSLPLDEPCLCIHQRVVCNGVAISVARLVLPAARLRLQSRSRPV